MEKRKGMIKLFFDDETDSGKYSLPLSAEDDVVEQMSRPKNKRLYRYGVEFSRVNKVEIIKE